MPKSGGIYVIKNSVSGKIYIGSAVNLRKRLYEHDRLLSKGNHRNPRLQASWNKHGPDVFSAAILENVEAVDATLLAAETRWIDEMKASDEKVGYNICPVGGTRRGAKMTPEQCERIGAAKRGNTYRKGATVPQETRDRIAAKLRGTKATPEALAKMSAVHKGVPKSAECKAKLSAIHNGRIIPQSQRDAISAALKGKKLSPERIANARAGQKALVASGWTRPPASDETKKKIGDFHRGKVMSTETRAKMSASGKGRVVSDEARGRISEKLKGHTVSDETRAKMRLAAANRKAAGWVKPSPSAETRAKIGVANSGRTPSDEARAKMSAARTGRVLSAETREKIAKSNVAAWIGRREKKELEDVA